MPMYTTLSRSSSIESDLEPLYSDGGSRSHSRKFRNFLAGIFVATFLACILVAMVVGVTWFAPKDTLSEELDNMYLTPPVNTTCGSVRGIIEDDVYVFKGIPYAAPPLGSRRWKPPTSLKSADQCWPGTYRAVEFGEKCYQTNMLKRQHEGSEDCLFINVWTPELGSHVDLDVVVFIHGGGLLYLSGNEPGYMPTPKIARSTNTVYVSFNYRLNAFGFLALDVLSWKSESGSSGNYGFMDQILALQWVRDNIRGFGGNPNKVTLVGHSSGGTAVFALMGAPRAHGLFHRAWIVSGSPVLNATLSTGEKDNVLFLNNTGCNFGPSRVAETYRCLYNLPPEDIANAVPWTYWMASHFYDLPVRGETTPALAIIDGDVLPKPPLEAIRDGSGSDVPVLISNMAQEVDEQPAPEDIEMWMWHDYSQYVRRNLNTFTSNISEVALSMYSHKENPEYQFTSMVSDIRAICPTDLQAATIARLQQSPVYRLVTTATPSEPVNYNGFLKKYAFHAWDMISFFGDFKQLLDTPAKKDVRLMKNLRRVLSDFIKDGLRRRWKQFPEATGIISNQIEGVRRYHANQCDFWVERGITPRYAWIN